MKPLILVGEDEPFFREAVQWLLEQHGMEVILKKNGKEVTEQLEIKKPDVLILDLLMPEWDGFYVLEYMRENHLFIPTIILSNLTEEIDLETGIALGVQEHVVKSDIDVDDLLPMVHKCLATAVSRND